MKHLIVILFACIANIALASFHGSHHSSHSSHHSNHTSHHSSGHTSSHSYHVSHGTSHSSGSHSTSHPYTHVSHIPNSYIHSTTRNNHLMYYYLLHNNHTNTHDTIYAGSQEELQEAVSEVSEEPATLSGGALLFIMVGVVCFVVLAFLYRSNL